MNQCNTLSFLGGLMGCVGDTPPLPEYLIGREIIKCGEMHIKTITETGWNGVILGHRSLELDNIDVSILRNATHTDFFLKGYTRLHEVV